MYSINKSAAVLLQMWLSGHVVAVPSFPNISSTQIGRSHSRDLPIKRDTDCGTWTMYCGGVPLSSGGRGSSAEDACNNACYYINNINTNFRARYRSDVDRNRNRVQSGCQTQQGSVCNRIPFSQRFHDSFERVTSDYAYNCDEFPMAAMVQPDFDSDDGIRNSLRCIKASENEAAGQQLTAFIQGVGAGLAGRTCDGALPDDANFAIEFNYDGADISRLGFCQNLPDTADQDPQFQFYLTELRGGESGRIPFPYLPGYDDNINKYAVATTGQNVLQCVAEIVRNANNNHYNLALIDPQDRRHETQGVLANAGDTLTLPAPAGLRSLKTTATGPVGELGTVGSEVLFVYGSEDDFQVGTDFKWSTLTTGTDPTLSNTFEDLAAEGGYCVIGNISDEGSLIGEQDLQCWFPCNVE